VIADLHCHYPMHLLARAEDPTLEAMVRAHRRPRWVDKLRAFVLKLAARLLNFRRFSGTWRVDLPGLETGDVRVVLSVLYLPFAEMDLDERFGARPESGYFADLVHELDRVEAELAGLDPGGTRHAIVRSADDLEGAQAAGRVAFVHCIEGGFHLGATPGDVDRNVTALARRGVRYVTLAHLFWRQVATNAPAIPFLADKAYNAIFPQPAGAGLTDLGEAAVRAMYRERILIDISHMREDAIDETFGLLEELDRQSSADPKAFPVIASHSAFRFGGQAYNLTAETVQRVVARDGVVGLILAQHQLNDGLRGDDAKTLPETVEVLRRHIDAIREAAGSHAHVGIGSDFDGFIKPTAGGLERIEDLKQLRDPLAELYPDDVDAILSGNALRVLRRVLPSRVRP
jgi:microsomal dipeptidase-like Zn-dependent dipeptidase